MELRERIANWTGWRVYGPAAGSAVTHGILAAVFASMLAASGGERMAPQTPLLPPRTLDVTLVSEALPPQGIRPTPPDPRRAPPKPPPEKSATLPEAPPAQTRDRKDQKQQQAAAPATTGGAASDDKGGVYLGDSSLAESGVPLGLRGLLETDPCNPKFGPKRGDCATRWDQRIGMNPSLISPSEEELKRMYPGIIPPCPYKVGCDDKKGMLLNGTRSAGPKGPMAGGPGGQGGIHDLVGRLGFNPDHTDPGFGD